MHKVMLAIVCMMTFAAHADALKDGGMWQYKVKPGDTLWSVASQHLISSSYVPKLQASNRIRNPYRLTPNSTLNIPYDWIKQTQSAAVLQEMSGDASAKNAQGKPLPLAIGQAYPSGTVFSTGKDAMLRLQFQDGSSLQLNANSTLMLQSQVYYPSTGAIGSQSQLDQGSANSVVNPNTLMPSRYRISTPAATTTVRGTEFRVRVASAEDSATEVLRGTVQVDEARTSVQVPAGFGTRTGKHVGKTVKLPAAPTLAGLETRYEFNPAPLRWTAQDGEKAYRLTLSLAGQSQRRLQERETAAARYNALLPGNGDYNLQVRAVDDNGLEGFDSSRRIELRAYPLPPLVIAPAKPWQLLGRSATLDTSASAGHPVRLQLADNPDFQQPLLDEVVESPRLAITLPAAGNWYWRSAGVDEAKRSGPFGPTQTLTAAGLPALFSWQLNSIQARAYPVANARYTLTLQSLDDAAQAPVTLSGSQPAWSLAAVRPGRYQARLTVDGDDGYHAEEQHPALLIP